MRKKIKENNMAGIEDYQMYTAHQLSQDQRNEWERRHNIYGDYGARDRSRPSELRLQPAHPQMNSMNDAIDVQDGKRG
jgi:hypothetical protein